MRAITTKAPTIPPPTNAMADRISVHSAVVTRNQKWLAPKLDTSSSSSFQPTAAREQRDCGRFKDAPHQKRKCKVDHSAQHVDLEGPKSVRLNSRPERCQLVSTDC